MICWTPKLLSAQQDIRDLSCTAAASLVARRETVRPKSQMQPTIAIERRAGSNRVGVSCFLASKSQPLNRPRHKSRDFVFLDKLSNRKHIVGESEQSAKWMRFRRPPYTQGNTFTPWRTRKMFLGASVIRPLATDQFAGGASKLELLPAPPTSCGRRFLGILCWASGPECSIERRFSLLTV
jgi:hypothetical protein